jgi:hypothetical protein
MVRRRKVEIVGVGLLKAAQILRIEEALDAGAGVEAGARRQRHR